MVARGAHWIKVAESGAGGLCGFGEVKEEDYGSGEAGHVFGLELADAGAEFGARHGGDLVGHEAARGTEAVVRVRLYRNAEERGFGGVRCKSADGYRGGGVEAVVLDDDDRAGFAGVVVGPGTVQISPRFI
jgi:hypothetical protein